MNIIQGTLTVNGRPRNGVTAKLWRAEAFSSPPQLDTVEPTVSSFQVGSSITTGTVHGGEGAYRFSGMDDGAYYVSLQVGSSIAWEGHVVSGGGGTEEFAHHLISQGHEWARCKKQDTITLFHAKGAGIVRQIFLAIRGDDKALLEDKTTLIKVFVNNEVTPSISCPLSQFFAYMQEGAKFLANRMACTFKNYDDGAPIYERGLYRYQNMPYDTEIRIDLEVGNFGTEIWVWSNVYGQELTTPQDFGRDSVLKSFYFEDEVVVAYTDSELLNITGRGRLDSLILAIESADGAQVLEGNLEIYRDGESLPSFYVTGTEDISGNAFYFGAGDISGYHQGATIFTAGPPSKSTQYRFFDLDRLEFETSLKILWSAGHKGQGAAMTQLSKCWATSFYYLDTQPTEVVPAALVSMIDEKFDSYGEGNDIAGRWIQRSGVSAWKQVSNKAVYTDTGVLDAWMYHQDSNVQNDYIVEADVKISNHGTGEVWVFARGSSDPLFVNRITFGLSAVGAVSEHPNYSPAMVFVVSGTVRNSSMQLIKADEVNVIRLEVIGTLVILSLKRSVDTDFREIYRFNQTSRNDGFAGVASVFGNLEIDGFRVWKRAV